MAFAFGARIIDTKLHIYVMLLAKKDSVTFKINYQTNSRKCSSRVCLSMLFSYRTGIRRCREMITCHFVFQRHSATKWKKSGKQGRYKVVEDIRAQ